MKNKYQYRIAIKTYADGFKQYQSQVSEDGLYWVLYKLEYTEKNAINNIDAHKAQQVKSTTYKYIE